MRAAEDQFVKELEGQLAERKVTLDVTDSARALLATRGYDPDNGARPLARVMQDLVKRPLSEELLFGKLEKGGHVTVDAEGDGEAAKMTFAFKPMAGDA